MNTIKKIKFHANNIFILKKSYFGDGIHKNQCGMTITDPDDLDKSTWKCYIGFVGQEDTNTIGALINVAVKEDKLDGMACKFSVLHYTCEF